MICIKVYSPSEASELIGIKTATLRKYSLLLEKQGYEISRNSKKHRYYQDKDVMTIRSVITASNSGITLEDAVSNVVKFKRHSNESNVIDNGPVANNNDIKELKEMVQKQNELIYNLTEKLDQQEIYIDRKINDKLIERRNKQMDTIQEGEPKKGFFSKFFLK